VPASPGVRRLVEDQAVGVHRYLGLDRVSLLLAAVVCSPLGLVFGSRDLLFCGVQEGLEAREEGLQVVKGSQPPGCPVELPGQRQDLGYQGFKYAYVFEHVGLSEVEEEAQQGGGHVEPVVHEQHH